MERKRTDCPALPPGWKKEEVIRKSGLSAGKSDVYYYSPTGKKFRSKPQLSRYLGNTVDLACFDFRTGKMMPGKLQKNKQRFRHDPLSLTKLQSSGFCTRSDVLLKEGPLSRRRNPQWLSCCAADESDRERGPCCRRRPQTLCEAVPDARSGCTGDPAPPGVLCLPAA